MDGGWGSHAPVLAMAAAISVGPILELGAGDWSTRLLHLICGASGRRLVTAETEAGWLERFEHLRRPWHELHHVDRDGWAAWERMDEDPWGVAFVDHAPGDRRIVDIERLRQHARLIVVHDTEEAGYCYEPLLSSFRFRWDWKEMRPWTSIVSDLRPLKLLEGL